MIPLSRMIGRIPRLHWRLYCLLRLMFASHRFFNELYALSWYQRMLLDWVSWLAPAPYSRILEVGCSTGGLAAQLGQEGFEVTGVDRSIRAIEFARRHRQATRLDFIVADALRLPMPESVFDLTLAASLLNLVDTPLQLLAQMARVTVVNGTISCLFPTPAMQTTSATKFIEANSLHGFSAETLYLWAKYARKLEPDEVIEQLHDCGLSNVQTLQLLHGMVCGIRGNVAA
jgi:ubiquinone/menaquinone biosynthesis C-methylase UbiE